MASSSTSSAPSSLYHYGAFRNFSTPSLRGVKSVSPVPMSDPRPHTVTSHRTAPSPTGVRDDSQMTPTLLPRKIRKSRSASLLSLRKLGSKKGTPVANSVPLPDVARTSPTPVSALGLYRHGSARENNSFSTLDQQESVGNDSSIMMLVQGEISRDIPDTPQSMAPSLPPHPSTTSGSSHEIHSTIQASSDAQESLRILAEVEQPWFHPPAHPRLPSTLTSQPPTLTDQRPYSVQTSSNKASTSEINQPESAIEMPWKGAPAIPDRIDASADLFQPTNQIGDVSDHAFDTGRALSPSTVSVEYNPISRYSGISQQSPPVTDVPSFSPSASHSTSTALQNNVLSDESPLVMPHTASSSANDFSSQTLGSDNGPLSSFSTSQDLHDVGSYPQPAIHAHSLSSTTAGPKFTYSIVNGIQPKAQQRHISNYMSLDTLPLPPIAPLQTVVPVSHNEDIPEDITHAEQRSSFPPPILPGVAFPQAPSIPLPETEENARMPRGPTYYRASKAEIRDPQGYLQGVDPSPATTSNLEDKFEDMPATLGPATHVHQEADVSHAPVSSNNAQMPFPVETHRSFKSDMEESLSLRLKEFQSQQQALRGTIESSRAEILQLRERIRAFRAEVDDEVSMQPQPGSSNVPIYEPASLEPSHGDRLRDSLVSMDDLDRRLTQMLESHGSGIPHPYRNPEWTEQARPH